MSRTEVSVDQILEVFSQINHRGRNLLGSINFWALQGLIEGSSEIAYNCLLKRVVNNAREANGIKGRYCDGDYKECAMTEIAIAGITRKPADVEKARSLITGLSIFLDRPFEARFLLEVASITRGLKDIVSLRQHIRDNKLSGHDLVRALLLLYSVTERQKFVDIAYETAEQIDDIRAWVAIYKNCTHRHKEVRCIIDHFLDLSEQDSTYIAVAVISASSRHKLEALREASNHSSENNRMFRLKKFAVIAAVTKDVSDLEQAYLAAKDIEKCNPGEGVKAWRLIVRILAGVEL